VMPGHSRSSIQHGLLKDWHTFAVKDTKGGETKRGGKNTSSRKKYYVTMGQRKKKKNLIVERWGVNVDYNGKQSRARWISHGRRTEDQLTNERKIASHAAKNGKVAGLPVKEQRYGSLAKALGTIQLKARGGKTGQQLNL